MGSMRLRSPLIVALLGSGVPACGEAPGSSTATAGLAGAAASSAFAGSSGAPSAGLRADAAGGPAPSVAVTGGPGGAASGMPLPSSSGVTLSSPPWPAGTEKIAISWVLHPSRRDADQVERKHVELVLRAGAALRVFPVEVTSTFMVVMSRQALCRRRGAVSARSKEVASLELTGGGFTTIDVRRATETSLEIAEIYETCGACDPVPGQPDPCPPQRRVLGHIEIPRGVSFTERILKVEVEQRGAESPGSGRSRANVILCPSRSGRSQVLPGLSLGRGHIPSEAYQRR